MQQTHNKNILNTRLPHEAFGRAHEHGQGLERHFRGSHKTHLSVQVTETILHHFVGFRFKLHADACWTPFPPEFNIVGNFCLGGGRLKGNNSAPPAASRTSVSPLRDSMLRYGGQGQLERFTALQSWAPETGGAELFPSPVVC